MVNHDQQVEMSEVERIEFNRRNDIAQSVIWAAEPYFIQRSQLDKQISSKTKTLSSYWYGMLLVVGAATYYLLSTGDAEINFGSWIIGAVSVFWVGNRFDLDRIILKRDRCQEKLEELKATWGSVASGSFWDVSDLVNDFGLVLDDTFKNWWANKQRGILERVCGYEKAALIERI